MPRFLLFCLTLCLSAPSPVQAYELWRNQPYGAGPLQKLDAYLPEHRANAPLVVMVHGGGWVGGDKRTLPVWRRKAAYWTGLGAIFVSVNYRLVPEVMPDTQVQDMAAALALVQRSAKAWGGDPERIVLMGHSAGAHLVALLAADPAREGARPWLGTVALDTAAYDVETLMQNQPSRLYQQAFGPDPAIWQAASPLARLQRGVGPLLLVCSQKRGPACPASHGFAQAVTARGGAARVLPQPLNHLAINAGLGAKGPYTEAVEAFLQEIGFWGGS
ncbi:alpha/beta hydrolase [Aliiroseovarius sp.]|uniref:alpha/beta hydrolase n=1 Tax=Aliiroseovarius sp. TaxID=1872442 RepID=UPI003BAA0A8B